MTELSELFYAGMVVSVIGCIIKSCKLCIYNVRDVKLFGFEIYNSTLLENRIQSNSTSSSNTLLGLNPMRPNGLLNV